MGKTRNGNFIPPKGKPSGSGKETHGLKDAFAVNDLETDNQLSDKYTVAPDEPAPNVHVRHPNRNVNKGEENQDDNS